MKNPDADIKNENHAENLKTGGTGSGSVYVNLSYIDNVKKFVYETSKFKEKILAKGGGFVVDAKSLMAIFSLDLTKDIEVCLCSDDGEARRKFNGAMLQFMPDGGDC